ncbi:hypothetical protein LEUCIP111803_00281 [Leucobacter soli]|uniref:DUF222 domain-containing protein n=1 Tax=Leucobacter soli TaxID=2812850 RepID=A0A916NEZ1_9MICO|nr:hypothetical protein LEUCIP111803_00281 [Leucobacter soli]
MSNLPDALTVQQRDALAAGVAAVERIDAMIHQLEYLKAAGLASLSRLASRIASDEGHPDHGELVHRAVEAEVAVATRTGQAAVASAMGHAETLTSDYPALTGALRDGAVSFRHTQVVVDAGDIIAEPTARAVYEAEIVPLAERMTAPQLRAHAKRVAEY